MIPRREVDRSRIDLVDPGRDTGVVRRHDLGTVVEIHLVAVVGGRVVGGGDDDAGRGVDLGDRPRQHGGRDELIEQHRPDSVRGHHARRVEREQIALAAGVVADDHAPLARTRVDVEQVLRKTCRRLPHDEPVHALRTGADGGAQSGGAELQPAVEAPIELVDRSGDQRLQLGTDVLVGFGGQPAFRLGAGAVDHLISVRSSTRGRGPT